MIAASLRKGQWDLACHVDASRLAAAGVGAGRDRVVGPTDRRTRLQTVAAVLV